MLDGEKVLVIGILLALFGLISPMWVEGSAIFFAMIILGMAMIGYGIYLWEEE